MGERIVLIDGYSILYRAFYGVPELTNFEGLHTNGIYGFLNILLKIVEEEAPGYLAVAFDMDKKTFRHEMYAEYKGTRAPMPPELREQVGPLKELLLAMNIPTVGKEGYEADDVLGTLARRCEREGMEVSIVSGDRDLLQLASGAVRIRIPKTRRGGTEIEDYTDKEVREKFSLEPAQIVDLKGLMGDTADNIPGVPGIGEKRATSILTEFGSVENAYAHIEEVRPPKARESFRENYGQALLCKRLATICTDVPLDCARESLALGDLYTREAFEIVRRLEFRSLLGRFQERFQATSRDSRLEEGFQRAGTGEELARRMETACRKERVGLFLLQSPVKNRVRYDGQGAWEEGASQGAQRQGAQRPDLAPTSGERAAKTRMRSSSDAAARQDGQDAKEGETREGARAGKEKGILGFAVSSEDGTFCALLGEGIGEGDLLYWLGRLAASPAKVGMRNLKDALCAFPAREGAAEDLAVAAYLLNPLKESYSGEEMARDFLGLSIPSYQEMFGKKGIREALGEDPEALSAYACYEAYVAFHAAGAILARLSAERMGELFQDVEMPLVHTLHDMERRGILVNRDALREYGEELRGQIESLEGRIYEQAGEEFNIQSPKQLGTILFEKMGLPFGKKTKTGYSTSADVLERLRGEAPIVGMILEYRQLSKLKSTYADGLAAFISEGDQRIHGRFHQTVTATGRISSTEPNLQNIPVRMEIGRQIRKVFIPGEGNVFLDADYSQIELRVLAHMSGDERLIKAYKEDQDIHRITASQVFHTPMDKVTKAQRRDAKAVNFGIIYGISSFGLGQDLNITKKEAEEYIRGYFKTYPRVKEFLDELVEGAKRDGYVETLYHRRRPVPELSSSNFAQRSFGERVAMNSPIQGTAADIIKIAMVRVNRRLGEMGLRSRLLLQVHDELLVEASLEEAEEVREILTNEMRHAAELSVPLEVDVKQGGSWYEAK